MGNVNQIKSSLNDLFGSRDQGLNHPSLDAKAQSSNSLSFPLSLSFEEKNDQQVFQTNSLKWRLIDKNLLGLIASFLDYRQQTQLRSVSKCWCKEILKSHKFWDQICVQRDSYADLESCAASADASRIHGLILKGTYLQYVIQAQSHQAHSNENNSSSPLTNNIHNNNNHDDQGIDNNNNNNNDHNNINLFRRKVFNENSSIPSLVYPHFQRLKHLEIQNISGSTFIRCIALSLLISLEELPYLKYLDIPLLVLDPVHFKELREYRKKKGQRLFKNLITLRAGRIDGEILFSIIAPPHAQPIAHISHANSIYINNNDNDTINNSNDMVHSYGFGPLVRAHSDTTYDRDYVSNKNTNDYTACDDDEDTYTNNYGPPRLKHLFITLLRCKDQLLTESLLINYCSKSLLTLHLNGIPNSSLSRILMNCTSITSACLVILHKFEFPDLSKCDHLESILLFFSSNQSPLLNIIPKLPDKIKQLSLMTLFNLELESQTFNTLISQPKTQQLTSLGMPMCKSAIEQCAKLQNLKTVILYNSNNKTTNSNSGPNSPVSSNNSPNNLNENSPIYKSLGDYPSLKHIHFPATTSMSIDPNLLYQIVKQRQSRGDLSLLTVTYDPSDRDSQRPLIASRVRSMISNYKLNEYLLIRELSLHERQAMGTAKFLQFSNNINNIQGTYDHNNKIENSSKNEGAGKVSNSFDPQEVIIIDNPQAAADAKSKITSKDPQLQTGQVHNPLPQDSQISIP